MASSSDVLPRPLSPVTRFNRGCSSSAARWRHRTSSTRNSARLIRRAAALEPHRHDHVLDGGVPRGANQAAAVRISDTDLDGFCFDRGEGIEQVADIEADLELIPGKTDLKLVLGFFLLRIVCLDRQQIGCEREANAAILLV